MVLAVSSPPRAKIVLGIAMPAVAMVSPKFVPIRFSTLLSVSVPPPNCATVPFEKFKASLRNTKAGAGRWTGRVVQMAGKLNDTSRMATVIISINNPLGTADHPASARLMIDDYVYADITGRELTGVIELPRAALQDDDTVWVNQDNRLDIRNVTLAWKSDTAVFLTSGVAAGEQVVMSGLATPVQGMPLKTVDDGVTASPAASAGK